MSQSAQSRRFFSYLFIGALALLFALEWGPGSRGCDSGKLIENDAAATVNGKPIPLREFAQRYSERSDQFRRQGIPSEMLKQFGIHTQVVDMLVNLELLAQAASDRGIVASDAEVAKTLKEIPVFQKDGRFDRETYNVWVREVEGTTDVLFEDKLRRQLAAQRLLQLVEASVVVSDDEVRARYEKDGNAAEATVVRFNPTMFAARVGTPKPADLSTWAKTNQAQIANHYEKNKANYLIAEQVKARQILLRLPADATAEVKADVKKRIDAIRADIVDNKKEFEAVAKEVSEDTETKAKGGDLGFVDRLGLPVQFADVLFALKPGEVTTPVETPIGWYLGTVSERKAAEQRSLESVQEELALMLYKKSKSQEIARAEATRALAEAKKGKTFVDLFPANANESGEKQFGFGQEAKPEAKATGEFNAFAESIPSLGAAPSIKEKIFAQKVPGLIDEVLSLDDSFVVAFVDSRKLPSAEDFEAKKQQLRTETIKAKQYEVRESFLKGLKQSATVVTNQNAISKVVGEG